MVEESATQWRKENSIYRDHDPRNLGTSTLPHALLRDLRSCLWIMTLYKTDEPDIEKLEASANDLQIGEGKVVEPGQFHKYVVGMRRQY
jgi:hypothetical protein